MFRCLVSQPQDAGLIQAMVTMMSGQSGPGTPTANASILPRMRPLCVSKGHWAQAWDERTQPEWKALQRKVRPGSASKVNQSLTQHLATNRRLVAGRHPSESGA